MANEITVKLLFSFSSLAQSRLATNFSNIFNCFEPFFFLSVPFIELLKKYSDEWLKPTLLFLKYIN